MISMTCIALAAYMEARQHYTDPDTMAAVAAVIMNRVEDHRYPDTPCAVIADGSFPWFEKGMDIVPPMDGAPDQWAWDAAKAVALAELSGAGMDITSTHFHTEGHVLFWTKHYKFDGCIGGNCFYTNDTPYK